jgi:hypothetical protein
MYDKLRADLDQNELLRLHGDGVSLVDAWVDYDPKGEPDDLELCRLSQDKDNLDRVDKARQALLTSLRNGIVFAVGRSSLSFMGRDTYSIVPPMLCRMNYVDWLSGSIKDRERAFSVVRIFAPEIIGKNISDTSRGKPKEMLKLINEQTPPGVQVLINYIIKNEGWDGLLRRRVVSDLNEMLIADFGRPPYYRAAVERRSWSNYKKDLRQIVEKSGKSYLVKWK